MADLSAKKREKVSTKDFGLPEKARTKEVKAGNLTKSQKERIDRKADKLLDK